METIGKVYNHTSEENLEMLPLWNQAISGIEIKDAEAEIFTEKHSHYIVIHDPLKIKFSKGKEELNKRFCNNMGVSVVSVITSYSIHYTKLYDTAYCLIP